MERKESKIAEIKFVCILFGIEYDNNFLEYVYNRRLEYLCDGAIKKLREEYESL